MTTTSKRDLSPEQESEIRRRMDSWNRWNLGRRGRGRRDRKEARQVEECTTIAVWQHPTFRRVQYEMKEALDLHKDLTGVCSASGAIFHHHLSLFF